MSINRWKKGYLCVGECLNPKPYVRVGASKWCAYERACERACVRACMSVCLFACMHECVCERVHACVWQCGACVVCYACSRVCVNDYSTSDRSRSLARSSARALSVSVCLGLGSCVCLCLCQCVVPRSGHSAPEEKEAAWQWFVAAKGILLLLLLGTGFVLANKPSTQQPCLRKEIDKIDFNRNKKQSKRAKIYL
jgi:hypothetical protein